MTAMNRAMVVAGISTLFQAGGQILFTTLALLQYFCMIDFFVQLPLLLFIKILYFHNPNTCGIRVTIGSAIEGMASQAQVLLTQEPLPTTRTLYFNAINLGLAVIWLFTCFGIMRGGAIKKESKPIRWPWLTVTVVVCAVDLAAAVIFLNDSFHTRMLTDLVEYSGGVLSGAGNVEVDTSWAAWTMLLIYSRFVGFFLLNLFLIVSVVIHVNNERKVENTGIQVEMQTATADVNTSLELDEESERSPSPQPLAIPRPGLIQSIRRMKERHFNRHRSPSRARNIAYVETGRDYLKAFSERKRTVNIPEKRQSLERAVVVVDTSSGRSSPPEHAPAPLASHSLPHLASQAPGVTRGRRGTAAELQGQLPWAYVPQASTHSMRDQLPPDEDLPPVPLPDYTIIPSFRKASVHRAASSLTSLAQKRDDRFQAHRPPLKSSDVLY